MHSEDVPINKVDTTSVENEEYFGSNQLTFTFSMDLLLKTHTQLKFFHGVNQEEFESSNVETS